MTIMTVAIGNWAELVRLDPSQIEFQPILITVSIQKYHYKLKRF